MESGGINADQNFFSRRQPPSSPERPQRDYNPSAVPEFESRSPQIPPKLPFLTTQNLQAATANGFIGGLRSGGGDPDEFYRDYRGVQQSANGYTDIATSTNSMPGTTSTLRANGTPSAPKHQVLPSARNNSKPAYRSASSSLDDRLGLGNSKSTSALNGYSNSRQQQPSVKDLLKRFDQNNEQPSAPARKASPRIVTKDINGLGNMRHQTGYQARNASALHNPAVRAGSSTRENGPGRVKSPSIGKSSQRTRFAAEDQHSNNTLSAVARAPRPRNVVAGTNSQASRSMTNLSPTVPTSPPRVPNHSLFGEVTASNQDFEIGHGIPRAVGRRTSESSLHHPNWLQERKHLDADIDASSPTTGWYRGATSLDDAANRAYRSPGHNRNHSDMPDSKVNKLNGIQPTFSTTAPTPTTHEPSSRIPVASYRYSGSSQSSSVASSRGNSRATSPAGKNIQTRFAKPEHKPWNAGVNPGASNTRSRTPTRPRGTVRNPEVPSANNTSLKAYISAPLPKLSPPLRSSRPRLPVSSAATTNSQQKTAERSGSPQQVRTGIKVTRTNATDHPKPKKSPERVIDAGPVDFEAHRAKIKRAYTKSLHENEQAEIRLANMRRLQERQAQHAAEAVNLTKSPTDDSVALQGTATAVSNPPMELHIDTSLTSPAKSTEAIVGTQTEDSPTLGVIPGAFVDDETPASAISNSTEIENEPQTEAPRLSRMVSSQSVAPVMVSNQVLFNDEQFSPEQAMHGMAHNDDEIHIMFDTTNVEAIEAQQADLKPFVDSSTDVSGPSSPGYFENTTDFNDYDQSVHAAIDLTNLHHEVSPIHSSSMTPLEPLETQGATHFDIHHAGFASHEGLRYEDDLVSPTNVTTTNDTRLDVEAIPDTLVPPSLAMNDIVQNSLHTHITDFDYESSDGLGGPHTSGDGAYNGLQGRELQPPLLDVRASRLSGWTDYSISTNDDTHSQGKYPSVSPSVNSIDVGHERRPTPPPKEDAIAASPSVPPKPDGYSSMASPRYPTSPFRRTVGSLNEAGKQSGREHQTLDESRPPGIVSVTPLWPEYVPPVPTVPQQGDVSPLPPTRSPPPPGSPEVRPQSALNHLETHMPEIESLSEDSRSLGERSSAQGSMSESKSSQALGTSSSDLKLSHMASSLDPKDAVESEAAKKLKKRLFQRRMVIKELIDTEAIYLKDMNVVEEIYKGTAEACPKLDTNDINTIFRNTAKLVAFSTKFLDELKSAGASVYSTRTKGKPVKTFTADIPGDRISIATTLVEETDEQKDRKTFIGANFGKHLKEMQDIYTDFLKNSEAASARLQNLQTDSAVKVWLGECNLVAKDLTQAWDLDALLVKPVQRITRYQLLLAQIFENTPEDHPDYHALQVTCRELAGLLKHIDELKRRIQVVGKIVGRKRKESDVRTGLAKAFGRREKPQGSTTRPPDDEVYVKLHEKFGDDYLRLQVVLRDVEFYTRQCTTYVNDFLRYLSSMELIMRMSASTYPELESKWARFNMSMRDMGTIALEDHITSIRTKVIEPFEHVIRAYGPPGLAMKKRAKRRLDYEKSLTTKSKDSKLTELVDQYEALNETLKLELPKLSTLTEEVGRISLIQFVRIQTQWYQIWKEKVKVVLEETQIPKDIEGIVDMFHRDFKYPEARAWELSIVNGTFDSGAKARASQSTQDDDSSMRSKPRPSNLSSRSRALSITSDKSPSLPTPDFAKRLSGNFTFSPIAASGPGLPQPYSGSAHSQQNRVVPGSPATADTPTSSRPYSSNPRRPSTSRSYTSDNGVPRLSTDYNPQSRRESGSNYYSTYHVDGPPSATRPYSGLFNSALPDGPEDSQRSSRASSRDRGASNYFNPRVLYLAASLFEFNISATKSEAGYPYLTYQAGEIFDVLAEKGELWLAKNQDDPNNVVGWIWSKHFARLATD